MKQLRDLAIVTKPSKGAFDLPAAAVAAQGSAVLCAGLAAIPAMRRDQFNASRRQPRATGRYRRRGRQSCDAPSDGVFRRDVGGSRRPTRAFLPRAGLHWGTQSKAAFPEEYPGRRPPPSTSCPCPAWFFRLCSPFLGRSETAVQKRFAPVELLALVQFGQECSPNREPHALLFPIAQPPPARGRRRKLVGQIAPARPAAQNPQDAFQHFAVVGWWPTTLRPARPFRKQGTDLLPLGVGQQTTVSRHRSSLGAAAQRYRPFRSN